MSDHLRPRFRYYVPTPPKELAEQFKAIFKDPERKFIGTALKYHVVVDFPEKDRHFWSPQLDLNLEKYEKGTLIRGLIGPRPNVWTVFMFFNAIAGVLGIGGTIIGVGQWSMENPPLALWLLPISIIIFSVVYFAGKTGKKIAHPESVELHEFLIQNLRDYTELELDEL
ncbi:hypothetical protein KFE94_14845 [bacterium SCSIO 12643]|nr:hypothetical protein KFE94_14845 [bacterium SCSIO 12643]